MDGSQTEVSFRISILGCRVADGKPRVFMFEPRTMIKASLVTACLCSFAHLAPRAVILSEAKDLHLLVFNEILQILRFAQNDSTLAFFRSL